MTLSRLLAVLLALVGIAKIGILAPILSVPFQAGSPPSFFVISLAVILMPAMAVALRNQIANWVLGPHGAVLSPFNHRQLFAAGCAAFGVYLFISTFNNAIALQFGGPPSRWSSDFTRVARATGTSLVLSVVLIVFARSMPRLAGWGKLERPPENWDL